MGPEITVPIGPPIPGPDREPVGRWRICGRVLSSSTISRRLLRRMYRNMTTAMMINTKQPPTIPPMMEVVDALAGLLASELESGSESEPESESPLEPESESSPGGVRVGTEVGSGSETVAEAELEIIPVAVGDIVEVGLAVVEGLAVGLASRGDLD